MIDLKTETLLTPAQAAKLRPPSRAGRPTHPSTIFRWMTRGIRGCRLETIRLGGVLFTSVEALQRFADRLTFGSDVPTPPTPIPDAAAVEAELDRRGV